MGFDCGNRTLHAASMFRFSWLRMLAISLGLILAVSSGCADGGPAAGPNASTTPLGGELSSLDTPHSDAPRSSLDDAPREAADSKAPGSTDGSFESAIRVQVAGVEEYDQILQSLRGKVVLVDFWATWCIPCVQQFPHTVSLHEQHRDQGLAVISVSMNDPSEEASVLTFLRNRHAEFHNILGKYGAGTEFAESFNMRGDIPFYKLYDRGGRLRYQFSAEPEGIENGFPISEMDRRVEQLLAEESP